MGAEGGVALRVRLGHGVHPLVGLVHVIHHVHPDKSFESLENVWGQSDSFCNEYWVGYKLQYRFC